MNTKKRMLLGAAALAIAAVGAYATGSVVSKTFRTTGFFIGLTQGTNHVTGHPRFDDVTFAGHHLVNLAMGRSVHDTNFPQEVMAMTFPCDLSAASLVVYDRGTSNVVATIAASTSIDSVVQQDPLQKGPDRAHFVAVLQIGPNGNPTNGLVGGYFTVAGRVHLDPSTGCPEPIVVWLDRDSFDRLDDDIELPARDDPDSDPLTLRTGLAHLIGVVDTTTDGTTKTILVPRGGLSIRRLLPVAGPTGG